MIFSFLTHLIFRYHFPSWILDSRSRAKKIPDPESGSAWKKFKYFNPKIVSKLSEIWSGLFIPDPDPDFIPDPRVKKAPDPDPQHCFTQSLLPWH